MKAVQKLMDNHISVGTQNVQNKEIHLDCLDEDETMTSPVLEDTFISSRVQESEPIERYYLIINDCNYEVNKSLYENVAIGDTVKMIYNTHEKISIFIMLVSNRLLISTFDAEVF